MPPSSRHSAPLASAPPLDARLCAEVGAELARVRVARGMSVPQVGEILLLSPRQVKALEEVELAAFHNPTFYVKALKKYAAFAELEPAPLATIAASVAAPDPLANGTTERVDTAGADAASRRGLVLVAFVLATVALVGAGGYLLWGRRVPGNQTAGLAPSRTRDVPAAPPVAPPSLPVAASAAAVVPPPAEPAGTVETSSLPSAFGSLRVLHSTWVFVRDADNVVIERTLTDGEFLELESQPTYLAVGSPEAELTIGREAVDVSRFVANGQIRIRAGDFDALVQGATPIPAPTVAGGR